MRRRRKTLILAVGNKSWSSNRTYKLGWKQTHIWKTVSTTHRFLVMKGGRYMFNFKRLTGSCANPLLDIDDYKNQERRISDGL